jgi:hypothetical protein
MPKKFSIEWLFEECMKADGKKITLPFITQDVRKRIDSGFTQEGYTMRYDFENNQARIFLMQMKTIDDLFEE